MKQFILTDIFRKKGYTFRVVTFFSLSPKRTEFSAPFVYINRTRLHRESSKHDLSKHGGFTYSRCRIVEGITELGLISQNIPEFGSAFVLFNEDTVEKRFTSSSVSSRVSMKLIFVLQNLKQSEQNIAQHLCLYPDSFGNQKEYQMVHVIPLLFPPVRKVQYHLSKNSYRKFHSNGKRWLTLRVHSFEAILVILIPVQE